MNGTKILGVSLLGGGAAPAGPAAAADLCDPHRGARRQEGRARSNINLPLSMVHNLSGMIPDKAREAPAGSASRTRTTRSPTCAGPGASSSNGPDATYLTVNDPDSKVRDRQARRLPGAAGHRPRRQAGERRGQDPAAGDRRPALRLGATSSTSRPPWRSSPAPARGSC